MSFLSKEDMKRKGEEFINKINRQYEFFSKTLKEAEEDQEMPLKKGDIPRLAVLLGLLDPFFFDLYNLMGSRKDLKTLAEAVGLDTGAVKIFVDKLIKNGLLEKMD